MDVMLIVIQIITLICLLSSGESNHDQRTVLLNKSSIKGKKRATIKPIYRPSLKVPTSRQTIYVEYEDDYPHNYVINRKVDKVGQKALEGQKRKDNSWTIDSDKERLQKMLNHFWDSGFGLVKMWFYDRGEMINREHGESENDHENKWTNQSNTLKANWINNHQQLKHENRTISGDKSVKWKNRGHVEKSNNQVPTDDTIETISKYLDGAGLAFQPFVVNSTNYSGN